MRWCVGWQRARLSKKPSSDRRHDSQQREREMEERGGRERGRQVTEKEKNDRDKERQRETTGAEMPVRKPNEDADLRQNDTALAGWD